MKKTNTKPKAQTAQFIITQHLPAAIGDREILRFIKTPPEPLKDLFGQVSRLRFAQGVHNLEYYDLIIDLQIGFDAEGDPLRVPYGNAEWFLQTFLRQPESDWRNFQRKPGDDEGRGIEEARI